MAKGQMKSNREVRKPKKAAAEKVAPSATSTVSAVFGKPGKSDGKPKKR
jgi:hypothetical protein